MEEIKNQGDIAIVVRELANIVHKDFPDELDGEPRGEPSTGLVVPDYQSGDVKHGTLGEFLVINPASTLVFSQLNLSDRRIAR